MEGNQNSEDVASEQSMDQSPTNPRGRRNRSLGGSEGPSRRDSTSYGDVKAGLRARFTTKPFEEMLGEMTSPRRSPSEPNSAAQVHSSREVQRSTNLATRLKTSMGFNPLDKPGVEPGDTPIDHIFLTNTRIASSLTLQQMLYYNVHFTYCLFIAAFISYARKGYFDSGKHADLTYLCSTVWLVFEPLRLLLGYSGNLQEKVPYLVVFMLITAFPQLPINAYFAFSQKNVTPFDKALGTVSLAFLFAELLVSVFAMRQIVKSQDEKFYLEDYEQKKTVLTTRGLSERDRRVSLLREREPAHR
eukprot:CAMPEP_0118953270 /NCGR_PEP_ID=MMETSP1169-20130426/56274_1 /TAXON_ID=36882 /ORGANISM="Pyramimonas obovata, Strain CCMP722" /LENGTH=301 /DNA_ID=CAMNT_0006900695 /DNA_START=473 /DNA_END=1375 /DNA_ORIENTATION=+